MIESVHEPSEAIEQVVDSFVARLRAGERPGVHEYVQQYPEHAEQLADLLPAIVMLEQHAARCNLDDYERQSSAALRVPVEIGDFAIVREIGRGGMGVVYEAVQRSLNRHVALKIMSLPAFANTKHLERFRFEARSAARLQHNHIVPVFGVGEFQGMHYYAMQFIRGQSLHQLISALREAERSQRTTDGKAQTDSEVSEAYAEGSSSPAVFAIMPAGGREFYRTIARIGLQVSEALSYAHSEGVLHRDIKPSNLLLDAKGDVWITDFGLAKVEGSDGLTETGDFIGTLRYMAPERLEGAFDRRGDIYSLGATLYEFLTRQSFFETKSHARLVEQILHELPPLPSRIIKSVPRDLETIIVKAIAKEPAARYRTAEELAEDFRRFLADKPILARRPVASEQLVRWCRRNPVVAALAGMVASLLVAAVVILAWSNARIRSEVVAKDKALASARSAVHQLLARVASEKLSDMPMSHPLRVALLEDATKAYEGLIALGDTDFAVRQQLAEVLRSIAGLQRELGRNADAENALQRSADLYEPLVAADPNPPAIREALAITQADLAYTWQFDTDSPNFKNFPVEAQYRRALATYESIEHDWPQRHEPVTLCVRYLADLANRRGDKATAERLWRQAISRGETYLQQRPGDFNVRSDVCWGCIEYYEAILNVPDRSAEADAILADGIAHAQIIQQDNPKSTQAADVLASLHFRQALARCRVGRIDEAIPIFHQSIREIETLCESFPWNVDYWNTTHWFTQESIKQLQAYHRNDEVDAIVRQYTEWLRNLGEKQTADAAARRQLSRGRAQFVRLLRSMGHDREAAEFVDDRKK